MNLVLSGIIMGFSIAAPVGPIGILCIRRTMRDGLKAGFATGMGAATADALYGAIAGFGMSAVSSFLLQQQFWLGLLGGLFLCYLGVRIFVTHAPSVDKSEGNKEDLFGTYTSTFFLTISNPATIVAFLAVFAAFGLRPQANYFTACQLVSGVFLGSALWWLILSYTVSHIHRRIDPLWFSWVNKISGVVILVFGIIILFSLHGMATVAAATLR